MSSHIKLKRLSVHRGAHTFFDEMFHDGVNIIHGANGSGKSTIADFIFFALGGDLREWRQEAQLADFVLAEIEARDTTLTLRREISVDGLRPMDIYFGAYEEAIAAGPRGWERFPFRRPETDGYSFSQIIFKAAGIPEAISDGLSNITMHQLLRVIYADQLTPINRIFRPESFDTWHIRQAVGDVLCGAGGYDLYALQIFLRDLEKEFDETSGRLRGLMMVASSYGDNVLIEHIDAAINGASSQRRTLDEQLSDLIQGYHAATASPEADALVQKQRMELSKARESYSKLRSQIETLEYEVDDSSLFIDHLSVSLAEFDDSAATLQALGTVRFEFCPSCFSPTTQSEQDGRCHLCGQVHGTDLDESRTLAVRLDLEMQLRESRRLQEERKAELSKAKSTLRHAQERLAAATSATELGRRGAATGYEISIAEMSRTIGRLDAELQTLNQRKTLAIQIDDLSNLKSSLNERISKMKSRIEAAQLSQAKRKSISYTKISENSKTILEGDLQEHSDFGQIDSVQFDFGDDTIALNGVRNRRGSASGMVILKNSFLLGLFKSSLSDPMFGLPRFMLMDNVEDKGMVEERSWNFQRLILAVSKSTTERHQIIYTTSKIAPELSGSPLVISRKFTKERKTLNLH